MRPTHPVAYPRLSARIAELGIVQVDLAQACDIAPGSLTHIIRGRLQPSTELRARLATALDAPVDDLFVVPAHA